MVIQVIIHMNNKSCNKSCNKEIKFQPSWLGKINWGLGCVGIQNIQDKNTYIIDNPNEKHEPIIYNDRKITVKNYNNKPYPDEYTALTYSISKISRHILGYREYHRYYLQPVILHDIPQPTENDKPDELNISNLENITRKHVNINVNGEDEPDNWSDNEIEPTFNDTILSDIDDYLEE